MTMPTTSSTPTPPTSKHINSSTSNTRNLAKTYRVTEGVADEAGDADEEPDREATSKIETIHPISSNYLITHAIAVHMDFM